ncbi:MULTISPECIES: aldehyde dehydrogenase family protein [unclassified Mycolicibacterium]|uniref:aldehyde dehydrogenase family protein n=1 Tax=unclassified Mycolicibacterium TaxID=2636767 RepID=UPI001390A942|nr:MULTISPECIES: aldehyde dehydrogenase family protein [unclassified Mycolicibacterium]
MTQTQASAASINPARPSELVGDHRLDTVEDVSRAVKTAREAQREWAATPIIDRGAILRRAAAEIETRTAELGRVLTVEEGKTVSEGIGEVAKAAQTLYYHASTAWVPQGEIFASSAPDEEIHTRRVPVGVVAAVTPWNFPAAIPVWKIAPALLWGNAVVWKSASNVPILSQALEEIFHRAGVPAGVLQLALGPSRLGQALVDADVDAVTFTGSTAVGRRIWQAGTERGVKVQTELGGHNAAVVFDDADLDLAASHVVAGAMASTGQKCTATRRVIVQAGVFDAFVDRLQAGVAALRVGNGLDEGVDIGPLVSASALREVEKAVESAKREGATVAVGGNSLTGSEFEGGYFFEPTVLTNVVQSMNVAHEEIFGPVLSVIRVADDDEAISVANATRYGLSAAAFTVDERRIRRATNELEAGLVHINNPTPGSEPHVPFGGTKESSGQAPAEQGLSARDFFTNSRTVFIRPGKPA